MEAPPEVVVSLPLDFNLVCYDASQQKQEEMVVSRAYQLEMFEKSLQRNVIVTMETGSGKTWIAKLRIEAELAQGTGKLIWFTAPTVVLAEQQHRYLSHHIPSISTRLIIGSDNTDLWSTEEIWNAILDVSLVISTPQVLLDGLRLGFVQFRRISLLIMDEAHHCVAGHPYNKMMQEFYHEPRRTTSPIELPFILGMTASPINTQLEDMEKLERNLNAVCISPTQQIEDYRKYAHALDIVALDYRLRNSPQSLPIEMMLRVLESIDIHEDPWVKRLSKETTPGALYKIDKVLEAKSTFSMDQLKLLKRNTEHLYEQLGVWATHIWLREVLSKLHSKVENREWLVGLLDEEHYYLDEVLGEIRDLSCKAIEDGVIVHQLSSKSESLVKFLRQEFAEGDNFSCVIFVERRSTAFALTKILRNHPSISCAVASFVGSSNSGKKTNLIDLVSFTTQNAELDDFRSGLRSILVATPVIEEGIDVPATNLVVLFDDALTVRSYIQRRGRARQVASKFVVMRSSNQHNSKYTDFVALEAEMKARYLEEDRKLQSRLRLEDQDEVNDRVYAITSTGAQLTFENARSLLEHYCRSLNKVPFEPNPRPAFTCQGTHESQNISAKVLLPSSLPHELKEVYGTGIWRTERLARGDAAFEAMKLLHEIGLINDHLLPPAKAQMEIFSVETQASSADIRPKVNPWLPIRSEGGEVMLHVYRLAFYTLDVSLAEQLSPVLLLLPTKLDSSISVLLHYTTSLQARVSYMGDRSTSDVSRRIAQKVTSYLILTTLRKRTPDPEGWGMGLPFYLLPDVPESDLSRWLELSKRTSSLANILMESSSSPEQIFALQHPSSTNLYMSYLESRDLTYKKSLFALPQVFPAVLTRKLSRRTQYLTKSNPQSMAQGFSSPTTASSSMAFVPFSMMGGEAVLKITECTVLHISPSVIATMQFFPSILCRIEFALVARTCCKTLLQPLNILDEPRLIEALTSPWASDSFHYERLEFYGDTLLKLYACLQVFSELQNSRLPEGYLTIEAVKLVNNARLQRAAIEIGLDQFMIHERFTTKAWKPETSGPHQIRSTRRSQTKTIADHVEAVIAVAYLDEKDGQDTKAVAFLNMALPEVHWKLPSVNAAAAARSSANYPSFSALAIVESMLGYTFHQRRLLAEALNHSSISNHVPTYGRLEFLGDAVLQRIVNGEVYHAPARYSQEGMHLRQIVCVGHSYLAFLCLGAHHDVERINVTSDLVEQNATLKYTTVRKYLWEYMTHSNPEITPAQQRSLKRYLECGDEIKKELAHNKTYPWALLASIAAPKFFSDILESVLAAVYIDSGADLGICKTVLGKLGLTSLLHRLVDEPDMVLEQPKTLLWQAIAKAGLPALKVVCWTMGEVDGWKYRCRLEREGKVYAEVEGAWCEDEAVLRASEAGLERFRREKGVGQVEGERDVDADVNVNVDASQLSLEEESGRLKRKRGKNTPEGSSLDGDVGDDEGEEVIGHLECSGWYGIILDDDMTHDGATSYDS